MSSIACAPPAAPVSRFWRDPALPFIEARAVDDGRRICYAKHTHETFSIGAVVGGRSIYLNGRAREPVGAGAVVIVNPEDVHACNPLGDRPWVYRMLYVDAGWITRLQHQLGFSANRDFRPFSERLSTSAGLYRELNRLHRALASPTADTLQKQSMAVAFFTALQLRAQPALAPAARRSSPAKLARAAEYIDAHCTRALSLDDICTAAGLSPSYLIRAFGAHYGMTPHAYLVNRRIQYGRAQLKLGRPIADVALDAGFADQAHFQRAFRKVVAATPGQYRG